MKFGVLVQNFLIYDSNENKIKPLKVSHFSQFNKECCTLQADKKTSLLCTIHNLNVFLLIIIIYSHICRNLSDLFFIHVWYKYMLWLYVSFTKLIHSMAHHTTESLTETCKCVCGVVIFCMKCIAYLVKVYYMNTTCRQRIPVARFCYSFLQNLIGVTPPTLYLKYETHYKIFI